MSQSSVRYASELFQDPQGHLHRGVIVDDRDFTSINYPQSYAYNAADSNDPGASSALEAHFYYELSTTLSEGIPGFSLANSYHTKEVVRDYSCELFNRYFLDIDNDPRDQLSSGSGASSVNTTKSGDHSIAASSMSSLAGTTDVLYLALLESVGNSAVYSAPGQLQWATIESDYVSSSKVIHALCDESIKKLGLPYDPKDPSNLTIGEDGVIHFASEFRDTSTGNEFDQDGSKNGENGSDASFSGDDGNNKMMVTERSNSSLGDGSTSNNPSTLQGSAGGHPILPDSRLSGENADSMNPIESNNDIKTTLAEQPISLAELNLASPDAVTSRIPLMLKQDSINGQMSSRGISKSATKGLCSAKQLRKAHRQSTKEEANSKHSMLAGFPENMRPIPWLRNAKAGNPAKVLERLHVDALKGQQFLSSHNGYKITTAQFTIMDLHLCSGIISHNLNKDWPLSISLPGKTSHVTDTTNLKISAQSNAKFLAVCWKAPWSSDTPINDQSDFTMIEQSFNVLWNPAFVSTRPVFAFEQYKSRPNPYAVSKILAVPGQHELVPASLTQTFDTPLPVEYQSRLKHEVPCLASLEKQAILDHDAAPKENHRLGKKVHHILDDPAIITVARAQDSIDMDTSGENEELEEAEHFQQLIHDLRVTAPRRVDRSLWGADASYREALLQSLKNSRGSSSTLDIFCDPAVLVVSKPQSTIGFVSDEEAHFQTLVDMLRKSALSKAPASNTSNAANGFQVDGYANVERTSGHSPGTPNHSVHDHKNNASLDAHEFPKLHVTYLQTHEDVQNGSKSLPTILLAPDIQDVCGIAPEESLPMPKKPSQHTVHASSSEEPIQSTESPNTSQDSAILPEYSQPLRRGYGDIKEKPQWKGYVPNLWASTQTDIFDDLFTPTVAAKQDHRAATSIDDADCQKVEKQTDIKRKQHIGPEPSIVGDSRSSEHIAPLPIFHDASNILSVPDNDTVVSIDDKVRNLAELDVTRDTAKAKTSEPFTKTSNRIVSASSTGTVLQHDVKAGQSQILEKSIHAVSPKQPTVQALNGVKARIAALKQKLDALVNQPSGKFPIKKQPALARSRVRSQALDIERKLSGHVSPVEKDEIPRIQSRVLSQVFDIQQKISMSSTLPSRRTPLDKKNETPRVRSRVLSQALEIERKASMSDSLPSGLTGAGLLKPMKSWATKPLTGLQSARETQNWSNSSQESLEVFEAEPHSSRQHSRDTSYSDGGLNNGPNNVASSKSTCDQKTESSSDSDTMKSSTFEDTPDRMSEAFRIFSPEAAIAKPVYRQPRQTILESIDSDFLLPTTPPSQDYLDQFTRPIGTEIDDEGYLLDHEGKRLDMSPVGKLKHSLPAQMETSSTKAQIQGRNISSSKEAPYTSARKARVPVVASPQSKKRNAPALPRSQAAKTPKDKQVDKDQDEPSYARHTQSSLAKLKHKRVEILSNGGTQPFLITKPLPAIPRKPVPAAFKGSPILPLPKYAYVQVPLLSPQPLRPGRFNVDDYC